MNPIPPMNNIESPQSEPSHKNWFLRHLLLSEIIAVVIILAGLGVYYYFRAMNPNIPPQQPIHHEVN